MMIYTFTINSILCIGPKVLAHVIPVMERTQGSLGTLEAVFDWQNSSNKIENKIYQIRLKTKFIK
jgi:hypothetical protein